MAFPTVGEGGLPIELCIELSTNHGGNVEVAADMIRIAADAGAHTIKLQTYSLDTINPNDPQADWLRQAHLDEAAHVKLIQVAKDCGVRPLSTPFDGKALEMLIRIGFRRFKIASSAAVDTWWHWAMNDTVRPTWIVSFPWGQSPGGLVPFMRTNVTAIPLYPTPLEAVEKATVLEGWSDHGIGLTACYRALSMGITYLEVHLAAPEGRGRICAWDKTPAQIRQLRDAIDDFDTIRTGISRTFRERWLT